MGVELTRELRKIGNGLRGHGLEASDVALDLAVDDDLRKRGWARDVVRQVQDLRKMSGLEVSDRIILRVVGLDAVGAIVLPSVMV